MTSSCEKGGALSDGVPARVNACGVQAADPAHDQNRDQSGCENHCATGEHRKQTRLKVERGDGFPKQMAVMRRLKQAENRYRQDLARQAKAASDDQHNE